MSFMSEQLTLNPCAPDGVISGVTVTQPPSIPSANVATPILHPVEILILSPRRDGDAAAAPPPWCVPPARALNPSTMTGVAS
jgi:hypothetical protein